MSKKRSDLEIAAAKDCLIWRVENGTMMTYACRELGISRGELRGWREVDPRFAEELKAAMEHLTECEADRLPKLHEEIPNPKVCAVASSNLRHWLELRNPKFRPKAEPPNDQPQLVAILKAAVDRLIDSIPVPAVPLLEVKDDAAAARAHQRMTTSEDGDSTETHQP